MSHLNQGWTGTYRVIIQRWRNRNGTAFIHVEAHCPNGTRIKSWSAKSQGPSSGGYCKATQAAEIVYEKILGSSTFASWGREELTRIAEAAATNLRTIGLPG